MWHTLVQKTEMPKKQQITLLINLNLVTYWLQTYDTVCSNLYMETFTRRVYKLSEQIVNPPSTTLHSFPPLHPAMMKQWEVCSSTHHRALFVTNSTPPTVFSSSSSF